MNRQAWFDRIADDWFNPDHATRTRTQAWGWRLATSPADVIADCLHGITAAVLRLPMEPAE